MSLIHKYVLRAIHGTFEILVPRHAKILSVACQDGLPVAWATFHEVFVQPDLLETRTLICVFTGMAHEGDLSECRFLGTVQIERMGIVCHYFEVIPEARAMRISEAVECPVLPVQVRRQFALSVRNQYVRRPPRPRREVQGAQP